MTPAVRAIETRITSLLKCRYPVLLPGMSWISTPELVAAVCNAGGVGILATGPLNADETRRSIRKIRQLLKNPESTTFGIGATLLMPGAKENAQVALEEQVPLINVSLGKADWISQGVKSYGGNVLATVTNAKHAAGAIQSGADALMLTGHEAAAHGGDVTSLVLVPSLAKQFPDVPIVAAGGFASGQGLAAALALGADAVAMGSRLAVTKESPLAHPVKEAVTKSTEADTVYGKNFDGIFARVMKTPVSERLMKKPPAVTTVAYRAFQAASQMSIPLYKVIPGLLTQWDKMYTIAQFGAATQRLEAATIDGDLKEGVQFIGQCQGLIKDIPQVDDLMQQIVKEAGETVHRTSSYFDNDDDTELDYGRAG